MKILAIGDPHGNVSLLRKIPKSNIDLILLTGDLGKADFNLGVCGYKIVVL